jgi:CHAT domain-containing protein/Tfp pilus assembly protein PilF
VNPRRLLRYPPFILLLAAGSCMQTGGAAAAYDRIVSDLERGNLQQAEQLVQESGQRWHDSAESPWHWRFRLLNAEVLIARGRAADARRIADTPVPPEAERPLEARRLKILGHAALNLGQYEEAAQWLEAASRATEVAALPRLALEVDVLRGLLLIRTNNQAGGETLTRAAYDRAVQQNDAYWQAAAANNLGLERMRAFRYDEAIPFLEQALNAAESAGAQRFSAASLANLGTCYYRIGDFDKALAFLQRAAQSQEKIGALAGLQSSLGDIGNVHAIQGRNDLAVPYYQRALALARSSAPADAAKWAGNLAVAHAELEQWDDAEQFSRESLTLQPAGDRPQAAYSTLDSAMIAAGRGQHEQAIRFYQETIALAADNAELTWVAHAGLGEVYLASGAPEKARTFFERCLQTIDAARTRLSRTEYKLTFFSRVIRLYQLYVDVLVKSGDHVRALEVAESSRALLLSERLQLDGGRRFRVTRAGLQETAGRMNVVFLSYWLGRDRSFLWVINRREFRLLELPPRDRIASLVDAYRAFIDSSIRDPIAANFAAARELYDTLLAPARPFVAAGSHVVLVPDGPLHALNVETLPVFDESPHYFIEEATVTVAPALALATTSTSPRLPDTGPLLLVGDPETAGPDYPRLPNADDEIAAIRERFSARPVTTLTGAAATPAAFEASDPARFSIIHFAAHATANQASPLDSSVVLSPHADGYLLSARDVLNQPLRADLVTISACRSAGSAIYGGEGLVGFVWAFLQAGAHRVIAGLWDVSDRSTSQLMEVLYARIQAGDPPAEALRQAKLTLIRAGGAFANPYYWGPFQIYIGRAAPSRNASS